MTITDLPAGAAQPTTAEESRPGECLVCFVLRRVEGVGCDNTLRWARAYRDAVAPADHGLERRLEAMGGYCDCEILMNAFEPAAAAGGGGDWPEELPSCGGVRPGSTVPCRQWVVVSLPRR